MRERKRNGKTNLEFNKSTYLEDPPRGTPVDPQRLGQRIVNRSVVVLNSCHSTFSAWASSK
jgi:hypothetical protein